MRRTHIPLAMLAAMAAMPSSSDETITIKPAADNNARMPSASFSGGGGFAPRIPSQAKRRKNRRRRGF